MPDTPDPSRELASLDAALAEEANRRRVIDHDQRHADEAVYALEREHGSWGPGEQPEDEACASLTRLCALIESMPDGGAT